MGAQESKGADRVPGLFQDHVPGLGGGQPQPKDMKAVSAALEAAYPTFEEHRKRVLGALDVDDDLLSTIISV